MEVTTIESLDDHLIEKLIYMSGVEGGVSAIASLSLTCKRFHRIAKKLYDTLVHSPTPVSPIVFGCMWKSIHIVQFGVDSLKKRRKIEMGAYSRMLGDNGIPDQDEFNSGTIPKEVLGKCLLILTSYHTEDDFHFFRQLRNGPLYDAFFHVRGGEWNFLARMVGWRRALRCCTAEIRDYYAGNTPKRCNIPTKEMSEEQKNATIIFNDAFSPFNPFSAEWFILEETGTSCTPDDVDAILKMHDSIIETLPNDPHNQRLDHPRIPLLIGGIFGKNIKVIERCLGVTLSEYIEDAPFRDRGSTVVPLIPFSPAIILRTVMICGSWGMDTAIRIARRLSENPEDGIPSLEFAQTLEYFLGNISITLADVTGLEEKVDLIRKYHPDMERCATIFYDTMSFAMSVGRIDIYQMFADKLEAMAGADAVVM